MANTQKTKKPKAPTTRESLARISEALSHIARSLEAGLYDLKGDSALTGIQEALWDIAEYGPGKAPKGHYDWRHGKG